MSGAEAGPCAVSALSFLVRRGDLRQTRIADDPAAAVPLADGELRARIGRSDPREGHVLAL
jgi:hypothetical protein